MPSETLTTWIEWSGAKTGDVSERIQALLACLESYTLVPSLELGRAHFSFCEVVTRGSYPFGIPDKYAPYTHHFFGNFIEVSHAFSIWTCDAAMIAKLKEAIAANMASIAYKNARRAWCRRCGS